MTTTLKMKAFADLLKIGLTEGEAKVYASLLELGPSTVGPITKRAKVSSSNIYEILERLAKKGIVTTIIKNNIKNFQAVSPVNLKKYLNKKQQELDQEKELLKEALPRIEALEKTFPKQEAMLFVGEKGLRAAYDELFKGAKKGEENLWIYVHDEKFAKISDKFYTHSWMELGKDIKSRGIADNSYRKSKFAQVFQKKYELRFVDFPIFSHGEVFRDKFMIVSWEDPIITVLVHAKHVSNHFKKYFEDIWKVAKH